MTHLVLDVPVVEQILFEKADRLARDYGLNGQYENPTGFIDALVGSMNQHGLEDPTTASWSPSDIFKAAVRSLGSNRTVWVRYLEAEPKVEAALHDFDPIAVLNDAAAGQDVVGAIGTALPSTTPSHTAPAIFAWAQLMRDEPAFFAQVQSLGAALLHSGLLQSNDELLPVVATVLSSAEPSKRSRDALANLGAPDRVNWKLPGMGFALASEFLRNLQWRGFKPDTHVKRLFDHWLKDQLPTLEGRATELTEAVGTNSKEARENIQYSLAGLSITPPGVSPSKIDNLVWLIGANIETKWHSTGRQYLTQIE